MTVESTPRGGAGTEAGAAPGASANAAASVVAGSPARGAARAPSALRAAGAWSLVATFAIALTPVTVFAIPWGAIDPALAEGTSPLWRDPLTWVRFPWLGPVYAIQGIVFAIAIVAATLALGGVAQDPVDRAEPRPPAADAPRSGRRTRAGRDSGSGLVRLGAAFAAAGLFLVEGGIGSVEYSAGAVGMADLLSAQHDAGIRIMLGVALTYVLNGLAGAIGLALLAWLLATALDLRRSGLVGSGLVAVVGVFGALMLGVYGIGMAGGAELIAAFPLAVVGIRLLVAAGRRARALAS